MMNEQNETRAGVIYAVMAYCIWGTAPIYFKQLGHIPAFEILTHRVVWSIFVLFALLWISRQFSSLLSVLKNPKQLLVLTVASLLLGANWLIYIWSVNNDRILEASLGYYINPLVNVLLGALFLHERLRKLQYAAVGLACLGVLLLLIGFGSFPWIALTLAFSFGTYGLLRKMVSVRPLPGLTVETLVLLPAGLIYLYFFASSESNLITNTWSQNSLLIGLGLLTTIPLLFFNAAAKRLMYSTIGFIQYLGPSIMFSLAVLLYNEVFSLERVVIFGFVWAGVLLFSYDSFRGYRASRAGKLKS